MKLYQSLCMMPCFVGTLFLADKVLQRRFSPLISTGIVTACVYMGSLYYVFATVLEMQKELTGKQRANFKLYQIFFRIVCFMFLLHISITVILFRVEDEPLIHRFQGPWKPLRLVVCILPFVVIFMFRSPLGRFLSCSGNDIENEFPEESSVGSGGDDLKFDDLAGMESARLVDSSENPFYGEQELDSDSESHNGENDEKSLPPPSYGELEHDEIENRKGFL